MRDAIVFSTWSWETFNVPERVALALSSQGSSVLYCEMPVSRFRRRGKALTEIAKGLFVFGPEYWGAKFSAVPLVRTMQWKAVAEQIFTQMKIVGLKNPLFVYSHIRGLGPLCKEMKSRGLPLIHVCMDYPEPYQYELINLSDRTLVIPKTVFYKLKAKYGTKIEQIPQSIHLPADQNGTRQAETKKAGRPQLGYLGPIHARLNLPMLQEILANHPEWDFVYFGEEGELKAPNAHCVGWHPPEELRRFLSGFDVAVMPYDCFDEKNLHCSPLKLLDYFLAGIPVVSTSILSVAEYSDLVYFGNTAEEFSRAIERALDEPATSEKRLKRMAVARQHSTEMLGRELVEILSLKQPGGIR
jgi:glycosyl transferase family 1